MQQQEDQDAAGWGIEWNAREQRWEARAQRGGAAPEPTLAEPPAQGAAQRARDAARLERADSDGAVSACTSMVDGGLRPRAEAPPLAPRRSGLSRRKAARASRSPEPGADEPVPHAEQARLARPCSPAYSLMRCDCGQGYAALHAGRPHGLWNRKQAAGHGL